MKKESKFIKGVIQYHNIVYLIMTMLVLYGIFGLIKMNKDEFPQFTIRQGVVVGVYPGATSEEVEQQLTKPLENYLFTYSEIDKQKTYSYSEDGMVYVFVELDKSIVDKNGVWNRIRHGLKDFKMQLPSGVLAVVVIDDFGNTSSVLLTIESKDKSMREMETYANTLCDKLRTIPSMGKLSLLGNQKEEISVIIDREKLASYAISSQMLMAYLQTQGFTLPTGQISSNDAKFPIHVTAPYSSEKEIAEQIIYSDASGNVVRLRDIARIERRYVEPSSYIEKDGTSAILVSMEMRPGNNIVEFGAEVDQLLDEFEKELPASVTMTKITNQPKVVGDSVWSFLRDLVTSIIVVMLVMLMLFPMRSALVASSGIPICTAISLAIMYTFNIELNTVTLAALIVVLGMMVDNSIVMIDGYIERINKGMTRRKAAILSAQELFSPLFVATVGICGMFFPVKYILTGPMADFVKLFPWMITISLMISLIYAIVVVPHLESTFIVRSVPGKKTSIIERAQNWFFNVLQGGYERLLQFCFKHPHITICTAFVSIALSVLMFFSMNIQMMPKAERDCFAVEITLPMGTSLHETSLICDSLASLISNDERITSITSFVGSSSPRFHATYAPNMPGSHYAQFIVNTVSVRATEEIIKDYSARYANHFPNAYVRFKQLDYQAVGNPIEVRFIGEDLNLVRQQADKLSAYMRTIDDLTWVHTDGDGMIPCVEVILKQDEATRLGVSKMNLSLQLASAMNGISISTLWEKDYSIPVKLYSNLGEQPNCEDMGNLLIPTALPNVWVPLRQVADLRPSWEPARIVHRNGMRCITVGSDLKYGKSQVPSMKKVQKYLDNEIIPNLPEGVQVQVGGLTEVNNALIPELVGGVLGALIVVFLFLLYDFKKIGIAVLSLSACLLCLFGAFFGLWIFKLDFGMTSVLGIVSLIGIIVRNGIIMFEYAEELRVQNQWSAFDAAFEAGKRRMRPIFLTSATTALGVVPMIISRSTLWQPMGIVICFGTIFSIVLIVTVLPVAYWQIYKHKSPKVI